MGLLDGFLRSQCDLSDPCGRVNDRNAPLREYDFVVVGGGSAGAAVAGRLSEEPSWNVLLLEAGGDEPPGAQVPSMVISYHGTELDWQYETQPEERACLSYPGQRCSWVRGKVLGGCSVLNGMMYTRGHPRDYDDWGLPGWRYADVLPFYKMSEDNKETARVGTRYHGVGGPLTVQRFPHRPQLADDILKAAREIRMPVSEDLNGDQITGFTIAQTTSRDGSRLSSAKAFLRPARSRPNLHVLLNSTATRVVIDPKTRTVTGVEFVRNGKPGRVRVTKEVVISGGAVNSPQLLLLSGVGPAEHLQSVGVPVIHDLPGVGRNLHNHVAYFVNFNMRQENDTFDLDWASAMQYMLNRTGPMSSTGLSQVTAILNSPFADKSGNHPDLQFFFAGYLANCARTGEVNELRDESAPEARRSVLMVPVVLHPRSRGRLELASADPLQPPNIYANYLTDDQDARTLVEGIKIALKLGNTRTLKDGYGFDLDRTPAPGCEQLPFGSDDYWDCAIRSQTGPENHQAGSCKMGLDDDPEAVVNPELKVIGITGLRVADASVMRTVISGNTNAPAIMIGERVVDFIKKQWKRDVGNRFGSGPLPTAVPPAQFPRPANGGESFQGSNSNYFGSQNGNYPASNNQNYNGGNNGYYNGNNGNKYPSTNNGNYPSSSTGNYHNHNNGNYQGSTSGNYNNGGSYQGGYSSTANSAKGGPNGGYNGGSNYQGTSTTGSTRGGNRSYNGNNGYTYNKPTTNGYTYNKPTTPWYTEKSQVSTSNPYAAPKVSRSLPLQPQPWWQRTYDDAPVGSSWSG